MSSPVQDPKAQIGKGEQPTWQVTQPAATAEPMPPDVVRNLQERLPPLHVTDLRKGDVLLSRGVGKLSDLIVAMDNGRYSHCALFDGAHFVQATTKGVVASEPKRIVEHQYFIDVFRFHTEDGRELDTANLPSQPILNVAQGFIGADYSYDELVMCAMIFVIRKSSALPYMGKLLEIFGGISLSALRNYIRDHVLKRQKQALVCTEVAVRSYWSASDSKGNPYGLRLDIAHRHGELMAMAMVPTPATDHEEYERVVAEIQRAFDELDPKIAAHWDVVRSPPLMADGNKISAIAGSKLFPAGCISPRDLQDSFSLKRIGRYLD